MSEALYGLGHSLPHEIVQPPRPASRALRVVTRIDAMAFGHP